MIDHAPFLHHHPAKVIRWIDGDTVVLYVDLDYRHYGELVHRLAWLDTKPLSTVEGARAKYEVLRLAPVGSDVIVRSFKPGGESGSFDRWLAEILLPDGTSVNQHLLANGFAEIRMKK